MVKKWYQVVDDDKEFESEEEAEERRIYLLKEEGILDENGNPTDISLEELQEYYDGDVERYIAEEVDGFWIDKYVEYEVVGGSTTETNEDESLQFTLKLENGDTIAGHVWGGSSSSFWRTIKKGGKD